MLFTTNSWRRLWTVYLKRGCYIPFEGLTMFDDSSWWMLSENGLPEHYPNVAVRWCEKSVWIPFHGSSKLVWSKRNVSLDSSTIQLEPLKARFLARQNVLKFLNTRSMVFSLYLAHLLTPYILRPHIPCVVVSLLLHLVPQI